jgi:hypothetical protein
VLGNFAKDLAIIEIAGCKSLKKKNWAKEKWINK